MNSFGFVLRAAIGLVVLGASSLAAYIPFAYLSEYDIPAVVLFLLPLLGLVLGGVLFLKLRLESKSSRWIATVVLAAVLSLYPISCWIGQVTHSGFGLNVYGLLPMPALDIVVHDNGVLWFRDKSHTVTLEEVESAISSRTEVLIIGTGWDGLVTVEEDARSRPGLDVRVLSTPDAIAMFNELRRSGIRVALICHSTC